jgi:hypothetical protein
MKTAMSTLKVADIVSYRARHDRHCQATEVAVSIDRSTTLRAFINEGRWIAKCPECNGGVLIHPDWPEAGCPDCGTWFTSINVPAARVEIEAVLAVRRPINQNWLPGETVEQLRFENDLYAHQLRGRRA